MLTDWLIWLDYLEENNCNTCFLRLATSILFTHFNCNSDLFFKNHGNSDNFMEDEGNGCGDGWGSGYGNYGDGYGLGEGYGYINGNGSLHGYGYNLLGNGCSNGKDVSDFDEEH